MEKENDTVVETTDDSKTEEVVEEVKTEEEKKEEAPDFEAENSRLKRELKQARKKLEDKPKEEKEAPKTSKKSDEEFGLLEITYLNGQDIKSEEEIEFVKKELEEAGLSNDNLPKLFANKYFRAQLEEFNTDKANTKATSGVKGGEGSSNAKNKVEFYIARGAPASKEDIPDSKVRRKINVAFANSQKGGGKTFYND